MRTGKLINQKGIFLLCIRELQIKWCAGMVSSMKKIRFRISEDGKVYSEGWYNPETELSVVFTEIERRFTGTKIKVEQWKDDR